MRQNEGRSEENKKKEVDSCTINIPCSRLRRTLNKTGWERGEKKKRIKQFALLLTGAL
jgi:hypothetical protein